MMKSSRMLWLLGTLGFALATGALADTPQAVTESARAIPVAATADVVVIGGSSGAVAAACSAAQAGAKVFLIAPRTYLGEDLAGTMRLWLAPGEKADSPLARKLFAEGGLVTSASETPSLKFSYRADQPADSRHPDTTAPSRLSDGAAASATTDSVQYNGDVTLTADLGSPKRVGEARLKIFQRVGDFCAASVSVESSADGRQWTPVATLECDTKGEMASVAAPLKAAARQVRFHVKRAPRAKRLLIGEIALTPETAPTPAPAKPNPNGPFRPLHIKKTLEEALAAADVQFLYGCYPADVLRDAEGNLCGVVMVNRAGRQAVIAKTIIDASEHAVAARLAGAPFEPFTGGPASVKWVTIAGKPRQAAGLQVRKLDYPVALYGQKGTLRSEKPATWFEYTLNAKLASDSWVAWAALEQEVRDRCYDPTQYYTSDVPFVIPPAAIKGAQPAPQAWPGAQALDLGVFRAAGVGRLWILGGCAAVARDQAEKLLRPTELITAGTRVGRAAAAGVQKIGAPQGVRVAREAAPQQAASAVAQANAWEIKETLAGLRPRPEPVRIPQAAASLPVLGSYDVVVIGGGTAGAPAGIGAARQGAKTLVVEYLSGLGGIGTLGMIGAYCQGNRVGFTSTVPEGPIETRMEWYRRELRQAGADVWFESMGCGTLMAGNKVIGAVVATPLGRGVVLAKTVVDATGNADIAIAGGAAYEFVEDFFALQNAHIPRREVGAWYINGDRPSISDADPVNVSNALRTRAGKNYNDKSFDWGQMIDTRERRRIVADASVDWLDILNRRTFPDSIMLAKSNYDSHGYQIHPYFMLRAFDFHAEAHIKYAGYMPYRSLLPRGMEGILVAGLGASAHRDAWPILRMQPDLHNQGYAAGAAAAMAAKAGVTPRQLDVKALQKHLVEVGNLAPSVLTDKDSYPLPKASISAALASVTRDFEGLGTLLAQPQDALPALRQAYAQAEGENKVIYAEVLGIMGDPAGFDTLAKEAGRLLKAGDSEGEQAPVVSRSVDPLTRVAWALGGTRERRAVPLLCTLAAEADKNNQPLNRAVVVSLGRIGEPAAAPTLERLLSIKTRAGEPGARELIAAVALYRCGDPNGKARAMLEGFMASPNGPWSELATQVLSSAPGKAKGQ